jgi:CRP-like cAMP-binding protein
LTRITKVELKRMDPAETVFSDDLLRKSALVKLLGEPAARSLFKLGTAKRFPKGAPVYRQSEPGSSLFFVLRGEARLFTASGDEQLEQGTAGKGELFGEAEVLSEAGVRSSSAQAQAELDAVELPRDAVHAVETRKVELLEHLKALEAQRRAAVEELSDFLKRW